MSKPPATVPEIDQTALLTKLSLVDKSSTLDLRQDEWGIAYGLFFTSPRSREDGCGDEVGCGGFDGAPAALITLPNALRPLNNAKAPKR